MLTPPKYVEHQLTEHCKLLQKAAVLRYDQEQELWQVLILQRSAEALSRPNCWDLPGGNCNWPIKATESLTDLHYQDLSREIQEETSLEFQAEQWDFDHLVHLSTYFSYEAQVYSIITGWMIELEASLSGENLQISDEHQASAWVSFADLPKYDFGGAKGDFVVDIIKEALARKNTDQTE
jgi:8-oxo-dGTP pyrophosphatase MutT (NUDIX family)